MRIANAKDIIKIRNITERTRDLYNSWKRKCEQALKQSPKDKKNVGKESRVLDGAILSRYEKFYDNDNGLCQALIDSFDVLIETRIALELEDYLAYASGKLEHRGMEDLEWNKQRIDWQTVAAGLREETAYKEKQEQRGQPANTPLWDSVSEAAFRLNCSPDLISDQILAYADRNAMCHVGITNLIDAGDFLGLAQRIAYIKELLEKSSERRGRTEMENYLTTVQQIQDEWFETMFPLYPNSKQMGYVLTQKGNEKFSRVVEKNRREKAKEDKQKEKEKQRKEREEETRLANAKTYGMDRADP